jgi:TolB-like protein
VRNIGMKMFVAVILFSWGFPQFVCAQERLAVLPLRGSGVEISTQETVYMLLVSEIKQLKKYDVVPESDILALLGDHSCSEADCAVEIGRQAEASKVVFGSLNRLGEKIILKYDLVDVSTGETLLSDDLGALRVEDLDQVTKRVAASIVQLTPADKTVEVGLVTEQESLEPSTRKANSSWGIGFGYLYPENGYENEQRFFVWDFRSLYEMRHFAVDALLGIRKGAALNVGFLYLVSRKDFSPYVGAGLGFHAVDHEQSYREYDTPDYQSGLHGDGLEFLFKGGLLAFRTYDFRVIASIEYSITLNDYDDRGVVLTIGVMRAGKRVFGIF